MQNIILFDSIKFSVKYWVPQVIYIISYAHIVFIITFKLKMHQ